MVLSDYTRDVLEGGSVQAALDDLAARAPGNSPDRRRYARLHSVAFAVYMPVRMRTYVDLLGYPGFHTPEIQAVDCDALVGAGLDSRLDGVRLTVHSPTQARSALVINQAGNELGWHHGYLTLFSGLDLPHKAVKVTNGGRAIIESCTLWLQRGDADSALLYASGPGSLITVANSRLHRSNGSGLGVLAWADNGAVIDLQLCRYDTGGRPLARETNGGVVKYPGCIDVS